LRKAADPRLIDQICKIHRGPAGLDALVRHLAALLVQAASE